MRTLVATATEISTSTRTILERSVGRGESITIFAADSDADWQNNYKSVLGPIIGLENLTIVGDYTESIKGLKRSSFYIVDPFLPVTVGKPKEDYGIDLIDKIKAMEGNCDCIWVLTENHDLLRTAESKGVKQLYTKRQAETGGYPTSDVFLEKIVDALQRGMSIGSDNI